MELQTIRMDDTLTVVSLNGRLDLSGVDSVSLPLTTSVATRRRPAIIDLSAVEFMASLGIGLLLRNAKTLKQHDAPMVLVGPRPAVEKTLRSAGVTELMPIAATMEEALRLVESGNRPAE